MISDSFVLFPDPYLKPSYHISPFTTIHAPADALTNQQATLWDDYCAQQWPNQFVNITENGRSAIYAALTAIALREHDTVTILTPSQNRYVSKCVTDEVEKFCKWNRTIDETTTCIFVIHEFGKIFEGLHTLKQYNLPIIEDCAYAFDSQNAAHEAGRIGDYCIYSLPKYFPMQLGGILTSKHLKIADYTQQNYILNQLSPYLHAQPQFRQQRLHNYHYLRVKFETIGLRERFTFHEDETPGVFMFTAGTDVDLGRLKEHCFIHGIESSVFYGEQAYFIPCHQYLSETDLDYFFTVVKYFINSL